MDVKGAGNSSQILKYKIVDNTPLIGTSYYRLKQTDFDGKYKYSKLVAITINQNESITISPNPVYLREMSSFKINGISNNKEVNVKITDIYGKLILQQTFTNIYSGELFINPIPTLNRGIYLVNIYYSKSNSYTKKLIVN